MKLGPLFQTVLCINWFFFHVFDLRLSDAMSC